MTFAFVLVQFQPPLRRDLRLIDEVGILAQFEDHRLPQSASKPSVRDGVARIPIDGEAEYVDAGPAVLWREPVMVILAAQENVVGFQSLERGGADVRQACVLDPAGQRGDQGRGDLVLNLEHVDQFTIVAMPPNGQAARAIEELDVDPHVRPGSPHAAAVISAPKTPVCCLGSPAGSMRSRLVVVSTQREPTRPTRQTDLYDLAPPFNRLLRQR